MAEEYSASTSRFLLVLAGIWLAIGLLSVTVPVFVPSYPGQIVNPIEAATTTMFALSFPSSLFAVPVGYLADLALGIDPGSIGGQYVNILVFFAFGLLQWFWVVPRLRNRSFQMRAAELPAVGPLSLDDPVPADARDFTDANAKTPLERVIDEDDRR
jgi:hypothetical protein